MRAVKALPNGSLNVRYCGESTSLLTRKKSPLLVAFSMIPRSPRYIPRKWNRHSRPGLYEL